MSGFQGFRLDFLSSGLGDILAAMILCGGLVASLVTQM